jgi:hypothetical protein
MTKPLRADPQLIKRYSPRQAKATCRTCGREWLGPRVLGVAAIRWGPAGSGGISPRCRTCGAAVAGVSRRHDQGRAVVRWKLRGGHRDDRTEEASLDLHRGTRRRGYLPPLGEFRE